jgi:hypothetical protein
MVMVGAPADNINLANVAAYRANAQLCATRMDIGNPRIFDLMMRLPDECTSYLTSSKADFGVKLPDTVLFPESQEPPSLQSIAGIPSASVERG